MVPEKLTFSPLSRRQIEADFSGDHITSDAGLLLLREVDKQHRLTSPTRLGTSRSPAYRTGSPPARHYGLSMGVWRARFMWGISPKVCLAPE